MATLHSTQCLVTSVIQKVIQTAEHEDWRAAKRQACKCQADAGIRVALAAKDERVRRAAETRVDRIHGLDLQRGSGRRPADADILLVAADEADSDLLRWLVLELLDEPTPVLLMLDKPSMTPAWIAWFASSGMVLSSATDQELIDSVRLVLNRCTVLPADVIVAMPSHWRAVFSAYWPFSPETQAAFDALTTRELGVLRLVGLGRRNSEIAAELWLSENTVRSHIRRMQAKLGVRGRLCMIILAHELGVTNIPG